jgi:hypothetical protein
MNKHIEAIKEKCDLRGFKNADLERMEGMLDFEYRMERSLKNGGFAIRQTAGDLLRRKGS